MNKLILFGERFVQHRFENVSALVLRAGQQFGSSRRAIAVEAWRKLKWRPLPTCLACGYGFTDMPEGLRHMPMALIIVEDVRSDVMILLGVCGVCLRLTDEQLLEIVFEDLKAMGITRDPHHSFGPVGHA
jgi:hypothetical protein